MFELNTIFILLGSILFFIVLRRLFLSQRRSSLRLTKIPPFDPKTLEGPWESRFAHVNGIKLHYVISGEQNQKLVLFLHGTESGLSLPIPKPASL
jgi:hypothetical protein